MEIQWNFGIILEIFGNILIIIVNIEYYIDLAHL